jgi:Holliday junction DNA helicase RuvB
MGNDSWRPSSFEEFVGQKDLIALLRDDVDAAIVERRPMSHQLYYGAPGLGKTAIADLLATVRGVSCHTLLGPGVTIESISKLLGDLNGEGYDKAGYLVDRDAATFPIIVLDECESVPRKVWESLHYSLEPVGGRSIIMAKEVGRGQSFKAWVPQVTWIGITNYYGKLRKNAEAAVARFPIKWNFQPYEDADIEHMLIQYANRIEIRITPDAVKEIAARSLGIPRNAIALIRQARTRLVAMTKRNETHELLITSEIATGSAELLKIDDQGLPISHRRYLEVVAKSGGKAGLPSIAAALCVDEETIRIDIEPDLIRKDLVFVVPGGRQLTAAGMEIAGLANSNPLVSRRVD